MELSDHSVLESIVKSCIRTVPDWPKPGIMFKDIQPMLADPDAMYAMVELMTKHYDMNEITKIAGIESRGLVLATAIAQQMGIGLIPLRKKGKLPPPVHSIAYKLEYGEAEIEVSTKAFEKGDNVLVVDDVLATGGTLGAAVKLIKSNFNVNIAGCSVLLEIKELNGHEAVDSPVRVAVAV